MRPDISFGKDVVPVLRNLLGDPKNRAGFEFMRAIGAFPERGYYDSNMPSPWLFGNMFFATFAAAELSTRAGGNPAQSARDGYRLPEAEMARLSAVGADVAGLLGALNAPARRVDPAPAARAYLEKNYTPTGKLTIPTLSMHAIHDGFAPTSNETVFAARVERAGQSDLLATAYTDVVGHNAFSVQQMLTAFTALDTWIATGTKPSPTVFPSAEGFVSDYRPPQWPR